MTQKNITMHWLILLILPLTIANAFPFEGCQIELTMNETNVPTLFQLTFQIGQMDKPKYVCINSHQPQAGQLMVRLDYLPYLCISASNDNLMSIENSVNPNIFSTKIAISRNCHILNNETNETLSFVYQIRPAFTVMGFTSYRFIFTQYLPAIVVIVFAAYLLCPFVFEVKAKRQ